MICYKKIKSEIINFKSNNNQLKVLKRKAPSNCDFFFKEINKSINAHFGFVNKKNAKNDIHSILRNQVSKKNQLNSFYDIWLEDMSNICKIFSSFLREDRISFWIGTQRGCKRYHVDMVPYRLLITYSGKGTEILPNYAANREAFQEGKSNQEIIKDKSGLKYLDKWDIAIFRGGKKGILHRTPDSALKNNSSLLIRLDQSKFLEEIRKINNVQV